MTSISYSANDLLYRSFYHSVVVIAGGFALIALVVSLYSILQHLRHYTNPAEQKWIVSVLFIVPVYATESIISLTVPRTSLACDILRNCYEAFALYAFGSYLVECLGGEHKVIEVLEDESQKLLNQPLLDEKDRKAVQDPKAFRNFFIRPCVLGEELLTIEKFGLVQYVILKTFCAFLSFLLEIFGAYGDGEFKWHYGYPYITVVLNFSQMWALYCLVQFYNVTHERLEPIKPLAKFISFKAIVFATWWQGVAIALLSALGVLSGEGNLPTGLQDFLICVEMAIAAVAHVFVFSAEPYHYFPASEYGKVTTESEKTVLVKKSNQLLVDGEKKPVVVEKTETEVKAPGTSITKSVQDIVLEGGQQIVEDVKLTINQAFEPVEKGVTKIQESIHHISIGTPDGSGDETDMEIDVYEEKHNR